MTASFLETMWDYARGKENMAPSSRLISQKRIAIMIQEIGESVEIYYEPRNVGTEWYVGLCDHHGAQLPLHEHFSDLLEGLEWLKSASMRELGVVEQSEFGDGVDDEGQ